MDNRFSTLRCKEVVNICDGCRLGCVSDVEIDTKCGKIIAIIIPGPCKFLGMLGRHEDFVIPWRCIQQIGDDIILINAELEKMRLPRPKKDFF